MSGNTHINLIYSNASDSYETSHSFYAPQFLCPSYFSFLLFFFEGGGGYYDPRKKKASFHWQGAKSSNLELKSESGGLVYDKLVSLFI